MPGTISLFISTYLPPLPPPPPKNAYFSSNEEQGLNVEGQKGDDRQESSIS